MFRDPSLDNPIFDLTPRQREVVEAISEGLTYAEIATRFGISHNTVKTHVSAILLKRGVRTCRRLVALERSADIAAAIEPA